MQKLYWLVFYFWPYPSFHMTSVHPASDVWKDPTCWSHFQRQCLSWKILKMRMVRKNHSRSFSLVQWIWTVLYRLEPCLVCVVGQYERLLFCMIPGHVARQWPCVGSLLVHLLFLFSCINLQACQEDELCSIHRFGMSVKERLRKTARACRAAGRYGRPLPVWKDRNWGKLGMCLEAASHNIYKKAINVTKLNVWRKIKVFFYVGGEDVEVVLRKVVRKDINLKAGIEGLEKIM